MNVSVHKFHPGQKLLIKKLILTLLTILPYVFAWGFNSDEEPRKHNILVLHSYHQQYKWTKDITKGIEKALKDNARLQIQYMDTKRQFDKPYRNLLAKMLAHRHSRQNYDIVIAVDNNAFEFVKKFRDSIFGNTPVVFCGINFLSKADTVGMVNSTGVNEKAGIKKTLNLIKSLQPNVTKLMVVADYTTTGLRSQKQLKLIKATGRHPFDSIHIINNLTMAQIEAKLQKLKSDWAVLYIPVFRDAQNQFFTYKESTKRITRASPIPVYGIWDFSLGYGIIGGYMVDGYAQGLKAGQMAGQIIDGKNPSSIPIEWESPNHYKFDYKQLERFDIDQDELPEGSILINEPYSLIKHDRALFWKILIVIIVLATLSLFLVMATLMYKRTLNKLEQNHQYLRALLNVVGDGIIDVDLEDRIKNMNYLAEKLTGYSEKEAVGKNIFEVFDAKPVTSSNNDIEYYLLKSKSGKKHKISKSINPVQGKTKESGYVIAFTDITRILENEERFSRLTENAKDLIYRIKIPDGIFEYVSPASKDILGYTPDELYKKPSLIKHFIPEEWKKYVFSRWSELKHGEVSGTYELQVKDKSGNRKWVNQRSVLVYDNEGNPIAMEGILTDISAQKDIEERLRESNLALEEAKERAEESDQLKSAFLANIAHEIRTPMNGIIGFAELLRNRSNPMSQKKYINVIQRSSERMLNIIDDLVNIAQIESGQTRSRIGKVDMGILLSQIERNFESVASSKGLELIIEDEKTGKNAQTVETDLYKLDYTIRRLVDNAIKYTREGYVKIRYEISDHRLEFQVEDTGIGISPSNKKKIFERFVQADNTPFKPEEGTGLGLAIARSFVEMMGGEISVESTPGKGSTFMFHLPIKVRVNQSNH